MDNNNKKWYGMSTPNCLSALKSSVNRPSNLPYKMVNKQEIMVNREICLKAIIFRVAKTLLISIQKTAQKNSKHYPFFSLIQKRKNYLSSFIIIMITTLILLIMIKIVSDFSSFGLIIHPFIMNMSGVYYNMKSSD